MEGKKDAVRSRQPFTPGWSDAFEGEEGLPIKRGNKVIRVRKEKTRTKDAAAEEEEPVTIIDDEADEEEMKATEQEKVKQEFKPKVKIVLTSKVHSLHEVREVQQNIADICTSITSNPEAALLRKDSSIDRGMKDLFQLLEGTSDALVLEWVMLSATLVFKDICPSYRIRTDDDEPMESGKQLKKDTKKLRDFELNLLKAYRRFLRLLDQKATEGLGNCKKSVDHWGLEQRVGMVAVRCQCELIKVLNQFNFRSDLLTSVVSRASQPQAEVSDLCCDTLDHLLLHDVHCDLSFEVVTSLSKILTTTKYVIPERLLRCLQCIKLTVHADKVKTLQQQVKSQRKKRRRTHDSVEAMMLEASQEADKLARQRFQGNSLQEIALIYFRILKAKVGFKLLPVALEGLGKVTPLLNLDTVNDLLVCLRNLLQLDSSPVEVRVLCIHCAMNTLLGPGQSLSVDDTMYYQQLVIVMKELTLQFQYWPALIDCVDMMVLKKRIDDQDMVKNIFKLLVIHAIIRAADIGGVLLSVAHNVLLRYPRLRQFMLDKWHNAKGIRMVSEEKVEDWAMEALRNPAEMRRNDKFAREHKDKDEAVETGKWTAMVLKGCADKNKCQKIVDTMLSADIKPLPFRAVDAVPGATASVEEEPEEVSKKPHGKFNKRKHGNFAKPQQGNNKQKKQRSH